MARNWSELSSEEKREVFERLHKLYEDNGKPDKLKVSGKDEIVNILNAGQQQANQHLSIKCTFSSTDKDKADALREAVKDAVASVKDAKVEISCARTVGSPMGDIENVGKMEGDEKVTVKHEAGQVILLDFWATWCPPCQGPMKHNQEMIVKHKEAGDWSKVRIIGLSIDQSQATLKSHVEAKGWGDVEHYWARNGVCNGDKDFGVRGVPHCCLVDTHGNIVWIGHPASRDLEKDINDLLAGKTLEGVKGGGDSDEEEEEEASATPVDFTKAAEAVESFKAASNGFLEETKKDAEQLMRAFLVLVNEAKCDLANGGQIKCSLTCHTVLVGPAASVEKVQAACMGISHAEGVIWKNREQVRAM